MALGRPGVWRVARNITSLVTSDVVNRATSFIVYAAVARYLGALQLGQLLLAVSFFQLFGRLAGLGLRDLVTREVARDRSQTNRYLANAGLLIAVASGVASIVILALVALLGYSSDTATTILILFLGLFPFGITQVTEATFIAWERTKYIAFVNVPINLLQTAIALFLLASGFSVSVVVMTMVAAYAAIAIAQWAVLAKVIGTAGTRIDLIFSAGLLKTAAPFFGMQATIAVAASINVVLLSKFVGEVGVGVYGAAIQLLVPLVLLTEATASVLFPTMIRRAKLGLASLKEVSYQATEFTIAFILPAVVTLAVLGSALLAAIYGGDVEFTESVEVLQIVVWSRLGLAITAIFARILLTAGRETTLLGILTLRMGVQLVSSVVLIWYFGVLGAAVSTLIVAAVSVIQHYVPVSRMFSGFRLGKVLWRPGLATLAMAVFFLTTASQPDIARLLGAGLVYAAVFASLVATSPGGFGKLWNKGVQQETTVPGSRNG